MGEGERIRALRKAAGLTQKELAERSGVAAVSIQQYERGVRRPRTEQLRRIASALGVSLVDLLPEPTEEEKAELMDTIKEIGLPRGNVTYDEAKAVLQGVSEVYGEKAMVMVWRTSALSDAGMDKVNAYIESIFQEYMLGRDPKAQEGQAPPPEGA